MRLRQSLIVSLTLVTGITLSGSLVAVSSLFDYSQRHRLDEALLRVAGAEAREASQFNFRFSARPGPAGSDVGPLRDFGVIYGERHNVMAATPPFDVSPPRLSELAHERGEPFDLWFRGLHLRAVLVGIPSSPGKTVLIASSRENLDATSAFLHRAMFAAFVVALLWSTVLVVWMVRRQIANHENIASVARRVARGDFDARVTQHAADREEAQLGNDIDHMIEQLSGLVTSQRRFTANAAHELRSPIAVVCGELQQTLRKPRDAEGYRSGVERALRGAVRLRHLAEDLLTLVRPTSEAEPVRTDVQELLHSAVAPLEGLAAERKVNVSVAGSTGDVHGHARDLERMFRNLAENGVRHAPVGGAVRLEAERREQGFVVRVTDDGPGVDEGDRDRIFDPFYRAPTSRAASPDGSGLGLAIAREIARAHRGDITLEAPTAPAGGARFVVRLPAA